MLLLLLNYVVLRALWKIDVHLISTLVNKSIYYYLFFYYYYSVEYLHEQARVKQYTAAFNWRFSLCR